MIIEDEKGEDPKMLSVPTSDSRFDGVNDINDIHQHKLRRNPRIF
ncbi:MAG: inorganic diphosphatase [Candidatus Aenigmarchaeota archaeon]|nr:inorganic diphosphatase [Candidatus Aenigmarchaeota archaeon]